MESIRDEIRAGTDERGQRLAPLHENARKYGTVFDTSAPGPDVRFDKHKASIQANSYVTKYGLRLLPDLYEGFNPMRYEEAQAREVEVGIDLRSAGFGVWQA